jgi:hypothetical protein
VYNNSVKLFWTTVFELNNDYFFIFRDGKNVGKIIGRNKPFSYEFTDSKVPVGVHNYFLRQVDMNGNFTDYKLNGDVIINAPKDYNISAFPNPFNSMVKISYNVPGLSKLKIELFDISGKKIMTVLNKEYTPGGFYETIINADNLSSGTYFCRIESDSYIKTLKLQLVK